jgi:serine/threonine protein kinase/TPR repeat protein
VAEVVVTEKPGDDIGRYKLLEKIGEGGCGIVYMAEQTEPIRRRVALKVIKLGMDTRQVVARFEAERQALALMDHPNIAKVLDAGATDTGRPYFVMELVKGVRITDYCDRNSLSTSERLDLFMQVCQAIQHAHQKGVIHRDIKPSNILITLHDGVAVPKVIDFGIAKATSQQLLTDKTVFTALHQFIGTPAYMSPEQAELSGLDIDTRSDIYALGVLLYELLTGKMPFDAKYLLAAGMDEIRRVIREQEPPKPSARLSTLEIADLSTVAKRRHAAPPALIHLVRGDLDWIVMKCLEKDRTRRYETANGLASDLLRHVKNEPVVARPPSKAYRFQKMVRRNKLALAATAAVAFALLLGLVVSVWQARRATQAGRAAEAARNQAEQRLAESEAISKHLTDLFRSLHSARDDPTITVAETLGAAARKLETDLVSQPARRAKLQATLGSTNFPPGLYREAIPLQEKVRDYYLAAFGPEHPDTLTAMSALAYSYDAAGRRDDALRLREEVFAQRRKVMGPGHPNTIEAMENLAISYVKSSRLVEALKLREDVLTLRRKVLGAEHPDTLKSMSALAVSYSHLSRLSEALKLQEQLVTLSRKVSGLEHPDTIEAMQNLANYYDEAGRWDETLKLREEVLAFSRKVLGLEHPDTLVAMYNLAFSYSRVGRLNEALKLQEQVLTLRRKVLGAEHSDTLETIRALAYSYDAAGRRKEALKLREEMLALRHKAAEQGNANEQYNLGLMYEEGRGVEKDEVEALKWYRKAAEQGDTWVQNHVGKMYENGRGADKDYVEALKWYRKAAEQGYSWGQVHLGNMYKNGWGLEKDDAEAVKWYRKAAEQGNPFGQVQLGKMYQSGVGVAKDYAEAAKWYCKAAEKGDAQDLNDLAWTLATHDWAVVRDGRNAVRFAELAVAATSRTNAAFLDTLAAAYAETHQFDKAVAAQQEAMALTQSEQEKEDLASRLKLYQSNTPYRQRVLKEFQSNTPGQFRESWGYRSDSP